MERDKFTCKVCGDKKTTLNIHHLKYIQGKDPWSYLNKDLVTVCEDCHGLLEEFKTRGLEFPEYPVLKLKAPNGDNCFYSKEGNGFLITILYKETGNSSCQHFSENITTSIIQFLNKLRK